MFKSIKFIDKTMTEMYIYDCTQQTLSLLLIFLEFIIFLYIVGQTIDLI